MKKFAALTAAAVLAATPLTPATATTSWDKRAPCVSVAEGEATRDGETRRHAERRYGTRQEPFRGQFELWHNGHRRQYWRSYEKCGGPAGIKLWVLFRKAPGPDAVSNWTWLFLDEKS